MNPLEWKEQNKDDCLDFSGRNLGIDGLVSALQCVRGSSLISMIDISNNINSDDSYSPRKMEKFMVCLERILSENKNIRSLLLGGNHLFDSSPHPANQHLRYYLSDFAEMLSESTITELDISDNNIIGQMGTQLSGFAHLCRKFLVPKAASFTCRLSRLHSKSLNFISESLGNNSHLIYLDLSDNIIGFDTDRVRNLEGLRQLMNRISLTPNLKTLSLARNALCDDCFTLIFNVIATMPQIQNVDVSGNYCSGPGAEAVKRAILGHGLFLDKRSGLTVLNLSSNPFGNEGMAHISEAMRQSDTIKALDLSNCGLDRKALLGFQRALMTNTALLMLDVSENNVKSGVEQRVQVTFRIEE
jgi:Ran GTPase-activating protein (RanGAP) involved in mRNA processing and transport